MLMTSPIIQIKATDHLEQKAEPLHFLRLSSPSFSLMKKCRLNCDYLNDPRLTHLLA